MCLGINPTNYERSNTEVGLNGVKPNTVPVGRDSYLDNPSHCRFWKIDLHYCEEKTAEDVMRET